MTNSGDYEVSIKESFRQHDKPINNYFGHKKCINEQAIG